MDENAQSIINIMFDSQTKIREMIFKTQKENLHQRRAFLLSIGTVSSAIIGFTLPTIGSSPLIRHSYILYGGLFCLLLNVFITFALLAYIYSVESKKLEQVQTAYEGFTGKTSELASQLKSNQITIDTFIKGCANSAPQFSKISKATNYIHIIVNIIIFASFFSGLVCITLSLIPW